MDIKKNKTRISLWINNSRFSKIKLNKYIITNGFSNKHKMNWIIYNFDDINECIELIKYDLLKRNINLTQTNKDYIENLYMEL